MRVIDAQLHDPAPSLDWRDRDRQTRHDAVSEIVLAYLDALGIAAAILVPHDVKWAQAAVKQYPGRLAYVQTIPRDFDDPDRLVAEAESKRAEGLLALRAVLGERPDGSEAEAVKAGVWDPIFAACERRRVPLFIQITGWLPLTAQLAERHPDLSIIVDHLGLHQPPFNRPQSPPFKSLPELLELARFPNIAVKLCGLPSLSAEAFPYRDVVPQLRSVVDSFGADRLMWASDITRFYGQIPSASSLDPKADYPGKHTYAESLGFIQHCDELTDSEKEAILGGTVTRTFG